MFTFLIIIRMRAKTTKKITIHNTINSLNARDYSISSAANQWRRARLHKLNTAVAAKNWWDKKLIVTGQPTIFLLSCGSFFVVVAANWIVLGRRRRRSEKIKIDNDAAETKKERKKNMTWNIVLNQFSSVLLDFLWCAQKSVSLTLTVWLWRSWIADCRFTNKFTDILFFFCLPRHEI